MDKRPMPAVKALIKRQGKILTLKTETENSVYWVLPGGRIEYGEDPLEALEREIKEELSCEPEIKEPIGMYHFFIGEENNGDQVVLTVYKADIDDQEIDISNNPIDENITEYRWLKPEELIEKTNNDSLEQLIRENSSDLPKLVRDKIPEIIKKDGKEPKVQKVGGTKYKEALRDKIVEEAKEFREDGEIDELADLTEVIEQYKEFKQIEGKKIQRIRRKKSEERGSFNKGLILDDVLNE